VERCHFRTIFEDSFEERAKTIAGELIAESDARVYRPGCFCFKCAQVIGKKGDNKFVRSQDSRRAILVDSDLKFGLARMFEVLRDTMGEKGIRVFRNLDDALDWIFAKDRAV
jgi:hypothetical protein